MVLLLPLPYRDILLENGTMARKQMQFSNLHCPDRGRRRGREETLEHLITGD
jgi:hypothetical protein